jgi:hypothetical protein
VVLYAWEALSVTLREEYRLRVFENRVLRRMFGPRRDLVTGGWRKQHNECLIKMCQNVMKFDDDKKYIKIFSKRIICLFLPG